MHEDKVRKSINVLAKKYRESTGNNISQEQARKRVIRAIIKKGV